MVCVFIRKKNLSFWDFTKFTAYHRKEGTLIQSTDENLKPWVTLPQKTEWLVLGLK